MSVILVFLLVIACVAGWWLVQQGLMSKPWLEQGAGTAVQGSDLPTAKIGLGVFLAVVGCLFALFTSAYFMRMEYGDWRTMPLPPLVWVNTALLVLSSVLLQCAVVAARRNDAETLRIGLVASGIAAVAFLVGQLFAWRELAASGYFVTENPGTSFFYLITGVHGLHIMGGLIALVRPVSRSMRGVPPERIRLGVELCATYWHFLLFVWVAVLVVLIGWAGDLVNICRQLLS